VIDGSEFGLPLDVEEVSPPPSLAGGAVHAPVLEVAGLSKKYARQLRLALAYGLRDIARELWPAPPRPARLRSGEFWALEDLDFSLGPGESLAVMGHNGAGKSTLLKILYGLLKPDSGTVRVRGRTEALIELGTGFNPLLTGLENIEIGAALHGLGRAETSRLVEDVIDFAELAEFAEAPLQSYSSGMKARLAYALASHLKPDLLLVDEVLAVGDLSFQRKCVNHMRDYLRHGGSLLLVSHNVHQIQAVCQRGILLDHGRLAFAGTAVETVTRMFEMSRKAEPAVAVAEANDQPIAIESLSALSANGIALRTGEEMRVTLHYNCRERVDAAWGFGIWTEDQWICVTGAYEEKSRALRPGTGTLECVVPRLPLLPGRYQLRAVLVDPVTRYPLSLFGWEGAGLEIDVVSNANAIVNAQKRLSQLTTIDVDWL
jgi:lipopolysaccharide transport system ATP-binding protein